LASPEPADWPKVSVIVLACNEIDALGDWIRAHANTSYPKVEIIVVDDRSSDGTSELVDTLAKQDRRIRALA